MGDRPAKLPECVADIGQADGGRGTGRPRFAHEQEDGRREDEEQQGRHPETIDHGDVEQEDEEPDEDGPAVPDGRADPGQLPARRGIAHGLERGVVVDERGLVGEVGDDEQDQPEDRRHIGDEERGTDAQRGEGQQERHPARATVGEGAEDRRHERIEADADDDRDRQQEVAVTLPELACRR